MAKTGRRTTIKEVAVRAGVTIGTVSHVINGTAPISPETTERVREAVRELDYKPNPMARYMRSKKSRMIGLMIPNLNNSFYSQVASTFMEMADADGYTVLILGYEYSTEREKKELESLVQNNVDAVVVVNGHDDEEAIDRLTRQGISVILADRRMEGRKIPYIQYDNRKILDQVVSMLKEKGYRSIGFISEKLDLTNLQDRFEGYKKVLGAHGYEFRQEHVFISEKLCLDNMRAGYQFTKDLLQGYKKEELPEAFLASSDLLAIGMLRAFLEAGYQVPGDFGVVGYDNLPIAGFVHPRLTTVNQDRELLGKELWRMTRARIEDGIVENVTLQQELIIRESC
ncbi:LacI family DNA-binding transcriptional regulator [Diplocloster modestus]|uniref:LacI family transcriptional regulator n=1 Tax=Diplocloster modestus TaxID=2850322 RepID=A0ABS6K782_9FIRM|nr:LacI family DNA-binding transcriptional regulator [Diplocloster modestus]MBU9726384.1 LacI family transcriptional regulator [Diplocloster modestus]